MCVYGVDSSGGWVSNLISQSYYQSQPPSLHTGDDDRAANIITKKNIQEQFKYDMDAFVKTIQ